MEKDFPKVQRKHAGTSKNSREKLEETVLNAKNLLAQASLAKEPLYELKRKEIEEYVNDFRHKGQHSLANEVDQSFRKVSECLAEFEDSLSRYKAAFTTNQREKLEMDFKREMKRIQRQRDQIKQWLNDSTIKDKSMLEEMKLIIETQMERYKTIERECKAREYSDYSLNVSKPLTALEKEKQEVTNWLNASIETLQLQIDKFELEIDEIYNAKKRKFDRQQLKDIDEHKLAIDKHKYHIGKLETAKRILVNVESDIAMMTSFIEKLKAIREDVKHYIESSRETDYEENDSIYEEIDEVERECFDGCLKASANVSQVSPAVAPEAVPKKDNTEELEVPAAGTVQPIREPSAAAAAGKPSSASVVAASQPSVLQPTKSAWEETPVLNSLASTSTTTKQVSQTAPPNHVSPRQSNAPLLQPLAPLIPPKSATEPSLPASTSAAPRQLTPLSPRSATLVTQLSQAFAAAEKSKKEANKRTSKEPSPPRRFTPIRMLPKQTLNEYFPQKYLVGPSSSTTTNQNSLPPRFSTKSSTKFSNSTAEPLVKPVSPWTQRTMIRNLVQSSESAETKSTKSDTNTSASPRQPSNEVNGGNNMSPRAVQEPQAQLPPNDMVREESVRNSLRMLRIETDAKPTATATMPTSYETTNSINDVAASSAGDVAFIPNSPRKAEGSSSWITVQSKRSNRPAVKFENRHEESDSGTSHCSHTNVSHGGERGGTASHGDYVVPRMSKKITKPFKGVSTKSSKNPRASRAGWAMRTISKPQISGGSTVTPRIASSKIPTVPQIPLANSIGGWKISTKVKELCQSEKVSPISSPQSRRPLTNEEIMFRLAFPPLQEAYKPKLEKSNDQSSNSSITGEPMQNNGTPIDSARSHFTFSSRSQTMTYKKSSALTQRMKEWIRDAQIRGAKRARYLTRYWPNLAVQPPLSAPTRMPNIPDFSSLTEAFESAKFLANDRDQDEENENDWIQFIKSPPPAEQVKTPFFEIPELNGKPKDVSQIIEEELVNVHRWPRCCADAFARDSSQTNNYNGQNFSFNSR